jgi:hypothetical protein
MFFASGGAFQQAHLPNTFDAFYATPEPNPTLCRSWLASDNGLEADAKPEGLIAGKPAPTVAGVHRRHPHKPHLM